MSYLSIISLEDAKLYLRVDDTLTEDDKHIQRMINMAFDYIERWTNLLVYSRQKSYVMIDGFAKVYYYPINSVVSTFVMTVEEYNGYTNYEADDADQTELKLNVGYQSASDVPRDLVEVAYELIDLYYYGNEKGVRTLSDLSIAILDRHKRFLF
jgi:hypothetical protein